MLKKQVEDPLLQLRNMVKTRKLTNDRGVIKRLGRIRNLTPVSNRLRLSSAEILVLGPNENPTNYGKCVSNFFSN